MDLGQKVDRFKTGLAAFGALLSAGFVMLILIPWKGGGTKTRNRPGSP